jgi:cardiolipin synthase
MIHAKTAVCDGLWARVGSTNLNISSWLSNWELDVVIENERIARQISEMYLEDLANATEIVLLEGDKVRPIRKNKRGARLSTNMRRSGQSMFTRAISAGSAVNAAVTGKRPLSRAESSSLLSFGLILCVIALAAVMLPTVFSYVLAAFFGGIGVFLLAGAIRLRFKKEKAE